MASSSTANVPSREAGGILTIDLGALVANWGDLAGRTASAECGAVIKADAYGCGIEPVARAPAAAGCGTFFVAHLGEGRRARAAAPDVAMRTDAPRVFETDRRVLMPSAIC